MLFLGFISGKTIVFPGPWAKTLNNPGSQTRNLTGSQQLVSACEVPPGFSQHGERAAQVWHHAGAHNARGEHGLGEEDLPYIGLT